MTQYPRAELRGQARIVGEHRSQGSVTLGEMARHAVDAGQTSQRDELTGCLNQRSAALTRRIESSLQLEQCGLSQQCLRVARLDRQRLIQPRQCGAEAMQVL